MKIVLDRARCTGLGICESIADAYFEIGDDGTLILHKDDVDPADEAAIEDAVRQCPTLALSVER